MLVHDRNQKLGQQARVRVPDKPDFDLVHPVDIGNEFVAQAVDHGVMHCPIHLLRTT